MKEIRTDCDTEYRNEIISELCKMLNIDYKFSVPYHRESLGSIERNHRLFNQYLRSFAGHVVDWEESLRHFTFCYNISTHSSFMDKFSPFELVFSRKSNLPYNIIEETDPIYNIDNYAKLARYRLQRYHKESKLLLDQSKLANKIFYDKQNNQAFNINIDDIVYIAKLPYQKHEKNVNLGPFKIIDINEPNVIIMDPETKETQEIHASRIRF